jgi:hypothetical protein
MLYPCSQRIEESEMQEIVLNYFMLRDVGYRPNRAWLIAVQMKRHFDCVAEETRRRAAM